MNDTISRGELGSLKDFDFVKTFQNLKVSSPASVTRETNTMQ